MFNIVHLFKFREGTCQILRISLPTATVQELISECVNPLGHSIVLLGCVTGLLKGLYLYRTQHNKHNLYVTAAHTEIRTYARPSSGIPNQDPSVSEVQHI